MVVSLYQPDMLAVVAQVVRVVKLLLQAHFPAPEEEVRADILVMEVKEPDQRMVNRLILLQDLVVQAAVAAVNLPILLVELELAEEEQVSTG